MVDPGFEMMAKPRQLRAGLLLFRIGIEMLAGPAKPFNSPRFMHSDCDPSQNHRGKADLQILFADGYSEFSALLLAVVVTEIGTYSRP
ncbi:hypothetical protein [Symmachiella dynata]|uniref:hypothetical protein n=1 Tax=Symmachiella dynata TaxID=2527995 RepID=UPI0030EEA9FC